jgi:queuine tRNA-ribosyltransferase
MKPRHFHTISGFNLALPLFFPDATRAVVKCLDSKDIELTRTPCILVNSFHLTTNPGISIIKKHGGIRNYMSWNGGIISDSGGFQIFSLSKAVTDRGVSLGKKLFSPQMSIQIQMDMKTDLVVVLDDFTSPKANRSQARESILRTLKWAEICKKEFELICRQKKLTKGRTPYIIGVVQGGDYLDLRKECTKELVKIGFDGLSFGGWPIQANGQFNYPISDVIRQYTPNNYFLYGLGVGKPDEIVNLVKSGWQIFDCVLPTRDARHQRLYVYNSDTIDNIDINQSKFYSFFTPNKNIYYQDQQPVSRACDCLLCSKYSRSYLAHLFRIGEMTAGRLATIHNLRFYSLLMEKLQSVYGSD